MAIDFRRFQGRARTSKHVLASIAVVMLSAFGGTTCSPNCPQGYEFCYDACRTPEGCSRVANGFTEGAGGVGMGGAAGGGDTGGVAGSVDCVTPADCPQPIDGRCGNATCEEGVCGLDFEPSGPIYSQLAGDCKSTWCDGKGVTIDVEDVDDFYKDGEKCTVDACVDGKSVHEFVQDGEKCPPGDFGYCYQGQCVECIEGVQNFCEQLVCKGTDCQWPYCTNGKWDPADGEAAVDCGGYCPGCPEGGPCDEGTDCKDNVCLGGVCQAPTCTDGARNGDETGVDCGGPTACPRCGFNEICDVPSDCESGVCFIKCEEPACNDGVKNGDETEVDCGDSCIGYPCP